MYLNLGNSNLIKKKDIIGVFDLDSAMSGGTLMEYLKKCEKSGQVINIGDGIPKAFVVAESGGKTTVYITTISAPSIKGRMEKYS